MYEENPINSKKQSLSQKAIIVKHFIILLLISFTPSHEITYQVPCSNLEFFILYGRLYVVHIIFISTPYVYVCFCMFVCVFHVCVCMCVWIIMVACLCVHVSVCECLCVFPRLCVYVCLDDYVCMFVCVFCMFVCVCCANKWAIICTFAHLNGNSDMDK